MIDYTECQSHYSGRLVRVTALKDRYGKRWLQMLLAGLCNVTGFKSGFFSGVTTPDEIDQALEAYRRAYGPNCPSAHMEDDVFHYHTFNFHLKVGKVGDDTVVDFGDFDFRTWPGAGEAVLQHLLTVSADAETPWDTIYVARKLREENLPASRRQAGVTIGSVAMGYGLLLELGEGFFSQAIAEFASWMWVLPAGL